MNRAYQLLFILSALTLIETTACTQKSSVESKAPSVQPASIVYQDINVAQAKTIQAESPEVVFLDVRTPEETADGIIPNAIIIDFRSDEFKEKLTQLDRETSYVVYCRSGVRSTNASKMMEQLGFKDVKNLEGGYTAWTESNN